MDYLRNYLRNAFVDETTALDKQVLDARRRFWHRISPWYRGVFLVFEPGLYALSILAYLTDSHWYLKWADPAGDAFVTTSHPFGTRITLEHLFAYWVFAVLVQGVMLRITTDFSVWKLTMFFMGVCDLIRWQACRHLHYGVTIGRPWVSQSYFEQWTFWSLLFMMVNRVLFILEVGFLVRLPGEDDYFKQPLLQYSVNTLSTVASATARQAKKIPKLVKSTRAAPPSPPRGPSEPLDAPYDKLDADAGDIKG